MKKAPLTIAVLATMIVLQCLPVYAQATRTWVSGVGDDANPCSRTAPCKTFAGAISKTASGGEISVLDPGGFGAVTITKSITLNGDGTLASILVSGTNAIVVNAGVNDKVIIRNLSINGTGTGLNGIRFLAGAQLTIDKCKFYGFTTNAIDVAKSADGELYVRDSYITNTNTGIRVTTTAGFLVSSIDNVFMDNMAGNGVEAANNAVINISNVSVTSAGGTAILASTSSSFIILTNSQLYNNTTALSAAVSGSSIRIINNNIFNNGTGFNVAAGATIASANNNKTGGNLGAGVPNGTVGNQ